MSDTEPNPELERVRKEHPQGIEFCRGGEVVMYFKPITKDQILKLKKQIDKSPELSLELTTNAVEFCCVYGGENYKPLTRLHPLLADELAEELFRLARGVGISDEVSISIRG